MSAPFSVFPNSPSFPRYGPVAAGAAAAAGAIFFFGLLACGSVGGSCDGGSIIAAAILVLGIEIGLVRALRSRSGRRFVFGFAFSTLGIASVRMETLKVWALPLSLVGEAAKPLWGPTAERHDRAAARASWVAIHRPASPVVVHGVRLVNAVNECIDEYQSADSAGGYPRTEAEIVQQRNCGALQFLALANDSEPTRFGAADNGWRWSYSPGASAGGRVSSYSIHVLEDPAIGRRGPELRSTERGVIRELQTGAVIASPVAALVTLRRCLTRVPAYRKAHVQALNWSTDRSTSGIVSAVCPELRRQLGRDPSGNERATLAVVVPGQPGFGADTVAVYSVELLPSDDQETQLALRAWPRFDSNYGIHGGARRFFLGEDGSTHVRTGRQMPDAADPIAAECLPGGGVDCGVAQSEAVPGP